MEQVPHFKRNKIFIGIEGARLREEQEQVRLTGAESLMLTDCRRKGSA
jgi:hypothetical protein